MDCDYDYDCDILDFFPCFSKWIEMFHIEIVSSVSNMKFLNVNGF